MKLRELKNVMVADQMVILYDRFRRHLERCFPSEIPTRYLSAEVQSIYTSGDELVINLRYGSFE